MVKERGTLIALSWVNTITLDLQPGSNMNHYFTRAGFSKLV